ncbi:MAG: spore germination protein [Oscillospiraceae bacterium]|nr:spore germination protein [Oscillospiraceae bacterium]
MGIWDKLARSEAEKVPYHAPKQESIAPITAKQMKATFQNCADFVMRTLLTGGDHTVHLFYITGLVDSKTLADTIIRPLAVSGIKKCASAENIERILLRGGVHNASARQLSSLDEASQAVLEGSCVVLCGEGRALAFDVRSHDKRSIGEPSIENVVKGSKDAFIENLTTNLMLVRRRIRSAKLKTEKFIVGRKSRTEVMLLWYEGLTNEKIVREARRRIQKIDTDSLISTGGIEEYICDDRKTAFPQMMFTERAANFAMNIMEGRAGVLIDGLPLGFVFPVMLSTVMRAPEDRSDNFIVASVLSVLRYVSLTITLLLPGFYVAIAAFHQEMIPSSLAISIIDSKQHVPFTTAEEAIIMLLAFEVLIEAGLRLPRNIGQTVSIIGGLIVGQSAVEAKLVSPVMVIVIAAAGITGFTVPNQDLAAALRLWRFVFVVLASLSGLFGLAMGTAWFILRLADIESFGVAYLSPFSEGNIKRVFTRAILRPPLWASKLRAKELKTKDVRSQR